MSIENRSFRREYGNKRFIGAALALLFVPITFIAFGNFGLSPANAQANSCGLYPIALSTQTLQGVQPGASLGNIFNGSQPGNFGWLSWTGDEADPTLATSLTPPGNSFNYINPNNHSDHNLAAGD